MRDKRVDPEGHSRTGAARWAAEKWANSVWVNIYLLKDTPGQPFAVAHRTEDLAIKHEVARNDDLVFVKRIEVQL